MVEERELYLKEHLTKRNVLSPGPPHPDRPLEAAPGKKRGLPPLAPPLPQTHLQRTSRGFALRQWGQHQGYLSVLGVGVRSQESLPALPRWWKRRSRSEGIVHLRGSTTLSAWTAPPSGEAGKSGQGAGVPGLRNQAGGPQGGIGVLAARGGRGASQKLSPGGTGALGERSQGSEAVHQR